MNIFHYFVVFYSPNDDSTNQEKYRPGNPKWNQVLAALISGPSRKTFEKSWKLWPLRTNLHWLSVLFLLFNTQQMMICIQLI